jgi:catechol 2,3-dioxygenase-like lactoylglutathione lyase family enzyme
MTCRLSGISIDATSPAASAGFWSAILGREAEPGSDGTVTLRPNVDTDFRIRFRPSRRPKDGPNRMHFDLTSESLDAQQQTVAKSLALGARHIDIGQRPEDGHVVLADPDGNEFCVIEPGNTFLAGCGVIGALNCDGSAEVGHFWSKALAWPLVWDQDEETAIQSPAGGPKITWSGPPLLPPASGHRQQFDLIRSSDDDIDHLLALGATRTESPVRDGRVDLIDPDGHAFTVLPGSYGRL